MKEKKKNCATEFIKYCNFPYEKLWGTDIFIVARAVLLQI